MNKSVRITLSVVVLSLALALPALAQTRGVTAEDYYAFETLGDPRFSPDGSTIAFVVTTIDQARGTKAGQEPLRSLTKFRFLQVPGISGAIFGQNAIPRGLGRVGLGDPVEVLATQARPVFKAPASGLASSA